MVGDKMKIALVYPQIGNRSARYPSGTLLLGTILKQEGHTVRLFDMNFEKGWGNYRNFLKSFKPELVGITALTPFIKDVKTACNIVHQETNAYIVVGGSHTSAIPPQELETIPAKYFIIGEGEKTLIEFLINDKQTDGIAYRGLQEIHSTPRREFIEDLDTIPIPDFSLLPHDKYFTAWQPYPFIQPVGHIQTARGCPHACSFCFHPFGKKVRQRSVDHVIQEIEMLKDQIGIKSLLFDDDTFTLDHRWVEELCEYMKGEKILWGCDSRVDTIDREIAQKMYDSGCRYMAFGVESGSQKILDILNKGITVEQIREAFKICNDIGYVTQAYLIISNPQETHETLKATEDLIKEIKPTNINLSTFTPYIGSELYDECLENGSIPPEGLDYSKIGLHSLENNFTDIPDDEFRGIVEELARHIDEKTSIRNPKIFLKKALARREYILKHPWEALSIGFKTIKKMGNGR